MLTMRLLRTWVVFGILMELSCARWLTLRASKPPVYEVYAVRYARLLGYPIASLVQGADRLRKLDLAKTFWVLKGPEGRTILIDAGFYRPENANRKDVADYTRPDKALERLGIKADQVTEVIITHMHWDHGDGVDLFPAARLEPPADHPEPRPGGIRSISEAGKRRGEVGLKTRSSVSRTERAHHVTRSAKSSYVS
jgi:Metallo-beta-lactamase superfamily